MSYNDRNLQAPYVGRGPEDDRDGYCTGDDYEDDRDVDFEYESWRDMHEEELHFNKKED